MFYESLEFVVGITCGHLDAIARICWADVLRLNKWNLKGSLLFSFAEIHVDNTYIQR